MKYQYSMRKACAYMFWGNEQIYLAIPRNGSSVKAPENYEGTVAVYGVGLVSKVFHENGQRHYRFMNSE